ncbi:hypothetical protein CXF68_01930 [Tenacibaculum sp. Bg11-29]|uniref:hypothetical protein n=1 Tax=Tenacibaculum sp. Bg11-29 TaxID=2058306 RepID=UPI000C34A0C7|nr:hypothetical protein [Tenacibaculum sp. Bg11-29]PKH49522.1 hypothetical protein CXF68_01930 [Tenacibaculum sp. Bg11-29]
MEHQIAYPPMMSTKKELSNHYWKLSTRFLKETINRIISESRSIDIEIAKYKRSITPKEFRLFVEEVDGI